jgi:hypothetical protein
MSMLADVDPPLKVFEPTSSFVPAPPIVTTPWYEAPPEFVNWEPVTASLLPVIYTAAAAVSPLKFMP